MVSLSALCSLLQKYRILAALISLVTCTATSPYCMNTWQADWVHSNLSQSIFTDCCTRTYRHSWSAIPLFDSRLTRTNSVLAYSLHWPVWSSQYLPDTSPLQRLMPGCRSSKPSWRLNEAVYTLLTTLLDINGNILVPVHANVAIPARNGAADFSLFLRGAAPDSTRSVLAKNVIGKWSNTSKLDLRELNYFFSKYSSLQWRY